MSVSLDIGLCLMFPITSGARGFNFLQFSFYFTMLALGFLNNSFLSRVYALQLSYYTRALFMCY